MDFYPYRSDLAAHICSYVPSEGWAQLPKGLGRTYLMDMNLVLLVTRIRVGILEFHKVSSEELMREPKEKKNHVKL